MARHTVTLTAAQEAVLVAAAGTEPPTEYLQARVNDLLATAERQQSESDRDLIKMALSDPAKVARMKAALS